MIKIQQLPTNLKHVKYIVHCADIHIRNWKRHEEYKTVFEAFKAELSTLTDDYIIVVAGDIAHSKTDMSPELVEMITEFFDMLTSFAPTICITGNHDINMNNAFRLDVLTPIFKALKNPNLFYLKETGVYQLADVLFSLMHITDPMESYIKATDIKSNLTKVALFHGAINMSTLQTGMTLSTNHTLEMFKDYDYALLGDIHRYQFLNADKTIAYPGSLIQQNFGEDYDNHGFILWDLDNKTSKFVHLNNDYGYVTVNIINGKISNKIPQLNKKNRVRFRPQGTEPSVVSKLINQFKKKYKINDIIVNSIPFMKGAGSNYRLIDGDLRDSRIQNELLNDFALNNLSITNKQLESLHRLNLELNTKLPAIDNSRNIVFQLKTFDFSNMFSYGENNHIDFSQMKGNYGILGENAIGKTAFIDALSFILFDDCSRTYKAEKILNNKKSSFWGKINFEINGVNYFIEKTAKKLSGYFAGKVKVNIDFWTEDEQGNKTLLNGKQRQDTAKIIESYIGSFKDFNLTALSPQNNSSNFIEKSQSERKNILSEFLDLTIFDQLYKLANDETNRLNMLVKELQKTDHTHLIREAKVERKKLTESYKAASKELVEIEKNRTHIETTLLKLTKKLSTDKNLLLNLEELTAELQTIEQKIVDNSTHLAQSRKSLTDEELQFAQLKTALKAFNETQLLKDLAALKETKEELIRVQKRCEKAKHVVKHLESQIEKLDNHKYDPNCEYCVSNVFVQDANLAKQKIGPAKLEVEQLKTEQKNLQATIDSLYKSAELEYEKYNSTKQTLAYLKNQLLNTQRLVTLYTNEGTLLGDKKTQIELSIQDYHRAKKQIEVNTRLNEQIVEQQAQLKEIIDLNKEKQAFVQKVYTQIEVLGNTIDSYVAKRNELEAYQDQSELYQIYSAAMSRDGIPYHLISKAIPFLETRINNILNQIVDFSITLNMDGKNIDGYIVYSEDDFWPLENTSGMEKFISSIAIRIALLQMTNLPRPEFLIIDEGFGVLDATNLNSVHMLFNYLKDIFKYTMIISHISPIKDMIDNMINVERKGNFSHIVYSVD